MSRRGRKPLERRQHGTRACYLRGPGPGSGPGCRCEACGRANRASRTERERAIVRGEWAPWTAAEPARAHVRAVMRTGLTQENVAALAGVAPGSMNHLMRGSNGNPPARRIRPQTARRILAVRPLAAAVLAHGTVGSSGTVRRLQALVTNGWPMGWLADELGMKRTNFGIMMRGTQVRASTAAAVRALYGRLWDQTAPQDTPRKAATVRAARAFAAAAGWAPPLAWDDETIDDPAAAPVDGWQRPGRRSNADLVEEADELARFGFSREHAAERLGVKPKTLDKARERARQPAGLRRAS